MKLKDFNLTFRQFASIVSFEHETIDYWRENYATPYSIDLSKDVEKYIRDYQQGENDNDQAIMYWLLVEMNVIDPYNDAIDPRVQFELDISKPPCVSRNFYDAQNLAFQKFIDNPT